jgi:hypothetical protein
VSYTTTERLSSGSSGFGLGKRGKGLHEIEHFLLVFRRKLLKLLKYGLLDRWHGQFSFFSFLRDRAFSVKFRFWEA